jgi:hypothetical protein
MLINETHQFFKDYTNQSIPSLSPNPVKAEHL